MIRFVIAAERLGAWFRGEVLPLWIETGYDHARDGFHEALDFGGRPLADAERRVRVQARQIYVMSRVGELGWRDGAEPLAQAGFEYLLQRACPDAGARGCVHRLSADGEVVDDKRDLYDQAFLLFACAWRWRVAKDPRARETADRTLAFMEEELASPHGGWRESDAGASPRRQNPHMHLFEAFTALFETTAEERFAAYADHVFAIFTEKFFDRRNGVLREYFTDALEPAPGDAGRRVEPGHMAEWAALLDRYARIRMRDVGDLPARLFASAREIGTSPTAPFLVDAVTLGEPPRGSRRLWPQTEFLKAAAALAAIGDAEAGEAAADMVEALTTSYLDAPKKGLWTDQYDGDGRPCAANVPASILYHLIDAVIALETAAQGIAAKSARRKETEAPQKRAKA